MKVYPVPGRLVRDPRSLQELPAEGREVPDDDPFWNRRLRDGDVSATQPDAPDPPDPEGARLPPAKEA